LALCGSIFITLRRLIKVNEQKTMRNALNIFFLDSSCPRRLAACWGALSGHTLLKMIVLLAAFSRSTWLLSESNNLPEMGGVATTQPKPQGSSHRYVPRQRGSLKVGRDQPHRGGGTGLAAPAGELNRAARLAV
jgi:hypothetical protein